MIIGDQIIYNENTLEPVAFEPGQRECYDTCDIQVLRAGRYPWSLYRDPEYDQETQKLDGVIRLDGEIFVTQGVVDI